MLRKVLPLAGILFIYAFSGCNKGPSNGQNVQRDSTADLIELSREGVIEYEIKTHKTIGVDPSNSRKVISQVHIKFPELKTRNKVLKKAVNSYVDAYITDILKTNMNAEDTARAKSLYTAAKAFIRSCKSNILEARKENPDWDQVWYCDIIGNVEMQSDRYFTLRFKHNAFTGGAHGEYGESYVTFNIASGKILTWPDVISDSRQFTKLTEIRFKQVNGMALTDKLTGEEGFLFENNIFCLPETFGLTSDGLVLCYQPYEVAPYSFGATLIHFKYFEILDLLNPTLFEEPPL